MEKDQFEEKKKHGSAAFPIQVYLAEYHKGELFEPHWHDSMEIISIISGSATFYIDDDKHFLESGDILFVNCDRIHAASFTERCVFQAIVFDLQWFLGAGPDICNQKYINLLLERKLLFPDAINKQTELHKDIQYWLQKICRTFVKQTEGYELYLKGMLTLIIASLLDEGLMIATNSDRLMAMNRRDRLKLVLNYMSDHFTEPMPVTYLAEISHMSVYYFCRYFKSVTGCTPVEYRNKMRIAKADKLLCTTDKRVIEIAYETGFSSLNYFSEVYRKMKGASPTQVRESLMTRQNP